MAEEQVTAPDQLKPTRLRWWRAGGVLAIVILLAMLFGTHDGLVNMWLRDGDGSAWVEDFYLVLTAAVIASLLVADALLRRRGLRL